ncbi:hypothetical protein D9Q98_005956 [Chlorella vulgaris]|uniref:Uncharacterized protein n=1 Tax=Chlorella vulgaris TaxID=3077 RepID=A0A9D4TWL0_CHLVU|nr:hypothetical protein D9Q98_005956 [Chlorella vulgaris]
MTVPTITVLVVDNTPHRASTLRLLAAAGYSTVEAQRGSEALKLLEDRLAATGSHGVDAILKNHDPPEGNAVRFLHRLRERPALSAIPTIIVSNLDSRDVVLKCLSSGAADYWVRPLRTNEVEMLWTRVWRPQAAAQQPAADDSGSGNSSDAAANLLEETEPTSKEGSAPDGSGSGSEPGKLDIGGAAGSGSDADGRAATETIGNGNGSSHHAGKSGSNTGEGSGHGNGTSATGRFEPAHGGDRMCCDASTAAQPALGVPPLPPTHLAHSSFRAYHHPSRTHRRGQHHHHHHSAHLAATAPEAGSEAPATCQQLAQEPAAAAGAAAQPGRQPSGAVDAFLSPAPRPRLAADRQVAAAGAAAQRPPLPASQVSGDAQYIGSTVGNGSNGAAGNGNGGVTSKQHAVAAGLPSPSRSPLQRHPASPGSGLPPLPLSAAGAAAAAAAAAGEARVSGAPRASPSPWPSQAAACWPADQQQREQQQQRQERQLLLNQIRDEQQEEVERQRGAAEVADVCEALTSLRESGSPLNSCGGGAPGGGVPSPAGPSGGAKAAKAARLTRSTAAATGSRPHAARSTLESGIVAPAGPRQGQAQQMGPAAGGPAQAQAQQQAAVAQALQFAPSLPQLFMQQAAAQAAAAAAMGRPSPATSPRQASAAATTQQQQQQGPTGAAAPQQPQQQQQMLPPPFLAGLTTQFGGVPQFLGAPGSFGWGGMPPLPSPQQQQYMQQAQAQAAAGGSGPASASHQQQAAATGGGEQAPAGQGASDATGDAKAAEQMHTYAGQQQQAMLAQQHGQQQAQYAWMLQQYSMAAIAAATTGQLPPPPPPPPPLASAYSSMLSWAARPPLPWQQQQQQQLPPSLSFPASILPAPASFNPQGPVTALLAPPSSLGVPGLAAVLPPLPLPPPLDVMSDAQLTKKEARMMAYARYREKRKRLHFGKKIRYQTRKALADQRPRVRGQFVRIPKEDGASTGDNKTSGGGDAHTDTGTATTSVSPNGQLTTGQQLDSAAAGQQQAAMAVGAAAAAAAVAGLPAGIPAVSPSPASTAEQQRDDAMVAQEEDQEYDAQEEDLGEEEATQPTALAALPRPRKHYTLLQDESESATMSFGGNAADHRQGRVTLHPHHQLQGATLSAATASAAAAIASAAAAAGVNSRPTGASASGPSLPNQAGGGGTAAALQQQLHQKLTGHKHRREPSVGTGRNGSDSGSNTPGGQTPVPASPAGNRASVEAAGQLPPPGKQARVGRK